MSIKETPNNDTDSSFVHLDDDGDEAEVEITVYKALARQIEYYFSSQNLMADTYLQTLRELNDGCVPVSIIANFSKVKTIVSPLILQKKHRTFSMMLSSTHTSNGISSTGSTSLGDDVSNVPLKNNNNNNSALQLSSLSSKAHRMLKEEQRRVDAVVHIMQQTYCDHLQIYSIDSRTGIISSNQQNTSDNSNNNNDVSSASSSSSNTTTNTISAIGFKPGYGIEQTVLVKNERINNKSDIIESNTTTLSSTSVSLDETNTLIIRDVDSNVSESEIRSIFDMISDCPTIVKVVPDIAACWYVFFFLVESACRERFHFCSCSTCLFFVVCCLDFLCLGPIE